MLDNPIAKKPQYSWLWITLLLLANHKEQKIMWNGEVLIIKEGQLLTGRDELSKQTGIPTSTIEDILRYLEKSQHQIQQQKTTKFRIITILNWRTYQNPDIKSDNKATTKQQQADTNKNDKNVKNDNNITTTVVRATPRRRDDIDILLNGIRQITGIVDGSQREQRNFAKNFLDCKTPEILHRAGNLNPTKQQIINATLRLFQIASKDSFHKKNCTSLKYVYNKAGAIVMSAQSNKPNVAIIS